MNLHLYIAVQPLLGELRKHYYTTTTTTDEDMAVSVLDAANHLCKKSGWTLTQIELQKLLYLAHMIHLGNRDEPLVRGDFEAWEFGPVHPVLYRELRIYGSSTITGIGHNRRPLPPGSERTTLDIIYDELGLVSASKLIRITHWAGGAWAKNYIPGATGVVIPQQDILEEFEKRKKVATSENVEYAGTTPA